ncbi:hypothetical protein VP01_1809g1 [Puccinia sorghi]|uniref:Uncharacterized protein n=1 Tax=Puccinia sorghi TaxID=27349 RepID=A0A0L6VES0_9BASI|nr:hypothetical protein VP01_1809g1 [Puccinia sorghi]
MALDSELQNDLIIHHKALRCHDDTIMELLDDRILSYSHHQKSLWHSEYPPPNLEVVLPFPHFHHFAPLEPFSTISPWEMSSTACQLIFSNVFLSPLCQNKFSRAVTPFSLICISNKLGFTANLIAFWVGELDLIFTFVVSHLVSRYSIPIELTFKLTHAKSDCNTCGVVLHMRLAEMSSPIRMLQCHIPPCENCAVSVPKHLHIQTCGHHPNLATPVSASLLRPPSRTTLVHPILLRWLLEPPKPKPPSYSLPAFSPLLKKVCSFWLTKAKLNPLSQTKILKILYFVYFGPPQLSAFWMAAWLEHAACQLQAVEQVFFEVWIDRKSADLNQEINSLCSFCLVVFLLPKALSSLNLVSTIEIKLFFSILQQTLQQTMIGFPESLEYKTINASSFILYLLYQIPCLLLERQPGHSLAAPTCWPNGDQCCQEAGGFWLWGDDTLGSYLWHEMEKEPKKTKVFYVVIQQKGYNREAGHSLSLSVPFNKKERRLKCPPRKFVSFNTVYLHAIIIPFVSLCLSHITICVELRGKRKKKNLKQFMLSCKHNIQKEHSPSPHCFRDARSRNTLIHTDALPQFTASLTTPFLKEASNFVSQERDSCKGSAISVSFLGGSLLLQHISCASPTRRQTQKKMVLDGTGGTHPSNNDSLIFLKCNPPFCGRERKRKMNE